jgi:hypothetical protein
VNLFLFFDADYLTAFIMAAVRADNVRQAHLAAVAALDEVVRLEAIMSAAAVTAAFGQFPFWVGRHGLTPGFRSKKSARAGVERFIDSWPSPSEGLRHVDTRRPALGAGRGKLYGHVVEMSSLFAEKSDFSQR